MYTKTNMIKTLNNAHKLVRAGYVSGEWQCHIATKETNGFSKGEVIPPDFLEKMRELGACDEACCAEGAIELAAGITHEQIYQKTKEAKYARKLLKVVGSVVDNDKFDNITDTNDSGGIVSVNALFKRAVKEIENG